MSWTCPCGDPHVDNPFAHEALKHYEASGLNECVDILVAGNGNHGWKVPRAWIAFHGLKTGELGWLTTKYGWTQID